jgi:hypothetical protein
MTIGNFHRVGPQTCRVCNMPRGLEPDRAFLMGLLMAHRFLRAATSADAKLQFQASMGLCPRHSALMDELTPVRPDGSRVG